MKVINEKLEMENRKKPMKKSDCESYERIKRDFFALQNNKQKDKDTLKTMLKTGVEEDTSIDKMVGFKKRTPIT